MRENGIYFIYQQREGGGDILFTHIPLIITIELIGAWEITSPPLLP